MTNQSKKSEASEAWSELLTEDFPDLCSRDPLAMLPDVSAFVLRRARFRLDVGIELRAEPIGGHERMRPCGRRRLAHRRAASGGKRPVAEHGRAIRMVARVQTRRETACRRLSVGEAKT